jgi:glutamate dehydrogenase
MLEHPGAGAQDRVDGWSKANERRAKFASDRLVELQATGARDFSTLAVAVREMRKLRRL